MFVRGTGEPMNRDAVIQMFLEHEFSAKALGKLTTTFEIEGGRKLKKAGMAKAVGNLVGRSDEAVDAAQAQFIPENTPKRWLAMRVRDNPISLDGLPKHKDDRAFLSGFNNPGWYGPFSYQGEEVVRRHYIGVVMRPWFTDEGSTTISHTGRWNIAAVVTPRHVTFHWKNTQYPKNHIGPLHWIYVKKAINDFMAGLGHGWREPDLKGLILDKVWHKYRQAAGASDRYLMHDTYVFAQEQGVSLRAGIRKADARALADGEEPTSGDFDAVDDDEAHDGDDGGELDIVRLTHITDLLAETALNIPGIQVPGEKERALARDAVRNAFIKEWTTRQYECLIVEKRNAPQKRRKLYMAKAFFGFDASGEGSFQHLKCDGDYGNSWGAARFLLGELGVW
ncbi:MAG: hypothetical protein ABMA64_14395 [Myxococcota bacterium]